MWQPRAELPIWADELADKRYRGRYRPAFLFDLLSVHFYYERRTALAPVIDWNSGVCAACGQRGTVARQARTDPLPSFGEQLRQARESQNITLQEIAATTKISSRALQALESEQFDQLPGGIFNKGFVRAYARYVGLDEEKMLAAYMAVAKPDVTEADMQALSSQLAAAKQPRKQESRIGGTTVMGVLAVIVALALGAVWFREHRKEALEQAAVPAAPAPQAPAPTAPGPQPGTGDSAAAGTPGAASPGAQPGGEMAGTAVAPAAGAEPNAALNVTPNAAPNATSNATQNVTPNPSPNTNPATNPNTNSNAAPKMVLGAASNTRQNTGAIANSSAAASAAQDAAAGAAQASPVVVSLSATQKAWISVRSDGKMVESLTLDPENPELRSRSYKAKEKLKLVVGNAGGVTAVCNGKPEGALGEMGQATTITFTSQGMQKR